MGFKGNSCFVFIYSRDLHISQMISKTASHVLDVYGSNQVWSRNGFIEAKVSLSGWALKLKNRPTLSNAMLFMHTRIPYCRVCPVGSDNQITAVLYGHNVWLEDSSGNVIRKRTNARKHFGSLRHFFYWDDLDMAYFVNYTFWNYFTFPALLINTSILWKEDKLGLLQAIFPENIPTHSKEQWFTFDVNTFRLTIQSCTAEIIGRFAHASHYIRKHETFNNMLIPTLRVMKLNPLNYPILSPILMDIKVHDFHISDKKKPLNHF
jgi:hypothetical protein